MNLICFYNSEMPVYSVTEENEIFCAYILNKIKEEEIKKEDFDNKIFKLVDNKIVSENYEVKLYAESETDSLDPIRENSKYYDKTYCFDKYELFEIVEGSFEEIQLNKNFFVCAECGKIVKSQDEIFGNCCEDCYVNHMQINEEDAEEFYTEYEKISKVSNVVEAFENSIKLYSTASQKISDKAKSLILAYLEKEKIEEKYYHMFLGGF